MLPNTPGSTGRPPPPRQPWNASICVREMTRITPLPHKHPFYNVLMEATRVRFVFTDLLRTVAPALDAGAKPQPCVSVHHSLRVAYIALRVARLVFLPERESADLVTLALLRDIGVTPDAPYNTPAHCRQGERALRTLACPAFPADVLRCHHENYDGTGLLGLYGQHIPLPAQILRLADVVSTQFNMAEAYRNAGLRHRIADDVRDRNGTVYSPETADAFLHLTQQSAFWYELTDPVVDHALALRCPQMPIDLSYRDIHQITRGLAAVMRARKNSAGASVRGRRTSGHIARWALSHRMDKDVIRKMLISEDLRMLGIVVPGYALETVPGFGPTVQSEQTVSPASRVS